MKLPCKFCKKSMEPIVKFENRLVTHKVQVFYCSICGKQLFVTGGIFEKPFWERPFYFWWLGPFKNLIYLEQLKTIYTRFGKASAIGFALGIILILAFSYFNELRSAISILIQFLK
ncbi:hypothetical protein [Legionella bozemanae]|uniref:hypothetical protein n=1 Tax=Legionella bozemanae TaxID=447 RepID=UPI0010412CA1|nr:hypothetical protein [Legionella bozemanae]